MLDDFFTRAIIAGIGIALLTGPLGCIIIWRRMAYFGDTLSHAALLGVALALLLDVNITLAVFVVSLGVALSLLALQRHASLSSDAVLGMLAHSSLALGLVCLAFIPSVRVDLNAFLFGDILSVSKADIGLIYLGGFTVLACLAVIWRALFAATVSIELAEAEGVSTARANLLFMLMMALTIALSMKIVGVLLMTALLIIPAATARRLTLGPERMAVLASLVGALAVMGGLGASLKWDTPSGPSIVVAAMLLFLMTLSPGFSALIRRRQR